MSSSGLLHVSCAGSIPSSDRSLFACRRCCAASHIRHSSPVLAMVYF
jgi:hypothetical protein